MIKILFIGMTPNPGGIETYTTNIFYKLQNKGFKFYFINSKNSPLAYSDWIKKNGGKIYSVPIPKNRIAMHLKRYSIAKHFFKLHHDFDIVHINAMTINQLFWGEAALACGVPHVIMQAHNSGSFHASKVITLFSKLIAFYNKLYINTHSRVIKLAATKDSGEWMFGHNSNYKIVNIGMDSKSYRYNPSERKLLRNKLKLSPIDKIIIITARIEKQKNYPKVVETFRIMHFKDKHVKLVIIGDGSKKDYVKSLINKYHLSKFTYFLGQVSKNDVARLLNIGDVMLIPSLCEAIPFSILESQAAGIPVVASKAIPNDADITNKVKFLSLTDSNYTWARDALNLLNNTRNTKSKIHMNNDVERSKFSLTSFIKHIKKVYLQIVNHE